MFDEKTLIDLDIGDLSQINLVMRLRGGKKLTVLIQLYDRSNVKIECDTIDSILKIKKKIYELNQELTVDHMDLVVDNTRLKNSFKVSDYLT